MTKRCVCGDSRFDHRRVLMSVKLENPDPIYEVKRFGGICATWPKSTYDHEECHCGCCSYEPYSDRD